MEADWLAAFYAEEFPRLVGFIVAFTGLNAADAQDVAQDSFMALMRSLEHVRIESMVPYLRVIARRMAMRYMAGHGRAAPTGYIGDESLPVVPDAAIEVTDRQVILQVIQELPPAQRNVTALTYEGFSTAEISGILGVTEATVRSHLRHARRSLSEKLRPESD